MGPVAEGSADPTFRRTTTRGIIKLTIDPICIYKKAWPDLSIYSGGFMTISATFAIQIHHRLLRDDPTAPSVLADACLETLTHRLRRAFPNLDDETLIYDAATDAILNYVEHPSRFDPAKSSLLTYLSMSARGDLLNALERETRRRQRETHISIVELSAEGRNKLQKAQAVKASEEKIGDTSIAHDLMQRVGDTITDPCDREMVELIMAGERKTAAFATVLGIQEQTREEQERIVKRHKDRLKKRLQRLGVRINDTTP